MKLFKWLTERLGEQDPDIVIEQIDSLLDSGKFTKAITFCERALQQYQKPYDRSRLLHRIGVAYGYTGDQDAAIHHLEEALEVLSCEPKSEKVLYQNANVNFHLGKFYKDLDYSEKAYNNALAFFEEILCEYPTTKNNCDILFTIAEIYMNLNDIDKAKHYYNLVYSSCHSDFEKSHSMLKIGDIEYEIGNYKFAEEAYKSAIKYKNPHSQAEIYLGLGKVNYELGNIDDAENNIVEALKYKKKDPYLKSDVKFGAQINYWLGVINYNRKKYSVAFDYFEKAIAQMDSEHMDYISTLIHLGHCYLAKRDFSMAKDCYNKVLESDTSSDSEKKMANYSLQRTVIFEKKLG